MKLLQSLTRFSPRIPGHETVGDVVAVGPGEKKWKVGDRVGAPWHGGHDGELPLYLISCSHKLTDFPVGTCKACNRGFFQMCDNGEVNGVTRDGGCAY